MRSTREVRFKRYTACATASEKVKNPMFRKDGGLPPIVPSMETLKRTFKNAVRSCRPLATHDRSQRNSLPRMAVLSPVFSIIVAGLLTLLFLATSLRNLSKVAAAERQQSPSDDVHPYHGGPPEEKLPPTLDPKEFDSAVVQNAYRLAAGLADVLYQEPCYCHCARHLGHTSLLDCYTTKHTAGCTICLKELFYIHEQKSKGRPPAQIRADIVHGEWRKVDLERYKKMPDPQVDSGPRSSTNDLPGYLR